MNVSGNLHEIIREERIKKGLSQNELGKAVGLSQQAINRIEHGKQKMDIELFEKLCAKLEIQKIGNFTVKTISSFYQMDDSEVSIVEPHIQQLRDEIGDLRYSLNEDGLIKTRDYMRDLIDHPKYKE